MKILGMFDQELVQLLEGSAADRMWNGISLDGRLRDYYDRLEISFEYMSGKSVPPNTYRIYAATPGFNFFFPNTVTFAETEIPIDMPSRRLIRMHRTIYLMLHVSGAGEYFDKAIDGEPDPLCSVGPSTRLMVKKEIGVLESELNEQFETAPSTSWVKQYTDDDQPIC